MDAAQTADRVVAGDARSIARLISAIENFDPAAEEALRILHRKAGRARVVGITGPPGSGKSTLTDKLVKAYRARGMKVAVVAVDPSSPFTGGAILGDRIRMQDHACDDGVFIRSLATRGFLGGLSRATGETVRVLDAAGYDIVLIETVGVGQSEVDIVRLADTVILVSVPGLGDDIQAIKAGVMEIGDVFVVNKADRDGADRVVSEIRAMLETAILNGSKIRALEANHHAGLPAADPHDFALPPILKTVAEYGTGVEEVAVATLTHVDRLESSGKLRDRRLEATVHELRQSVGFRILSRLGDEAASRALARLAESVLDRKTDLFEATEELLSQLK